MEKEMERLKELEPLWERDMGLLLGNPPPFGLVAATVLRALKV